MRLLQLPLCAFGKHQRDRRFAHHEGAVLRSRCTGCGKPMVKDHKGWRLG